MVAELFDKETLSLEEAVIRLGAISFEEPMSKEQFTLLAERFPYLRMEREADGKVLIMSPVKRGSGKREPKLSGFLFMWHNQHGLGELHRPSSGFDLPDGSTKSPDVAWISEERLRNISNDDEEIFVPVVPDFVAEVRSATDRLKKTQQKMTETWMANGVRLAWLIDPYEEKAYIYQQDREVEIIEGLDGKKLSGEDVLPGFELPQEAMKRKI
ncbi:MAG: Uma2 family endonuclease [Saprospiraceae bacterium]|nr:Uma2 family endonuclease [Saprospiraceae bacterium]